MSAFPIALNRKALDSNCKIYTPFLCSPLTLTISLPQECRSSLIALLKPHDDREHLPVDELAILRHPHIVNNSLDITVQTSGFALTTRFRSPFRSPPASYSHGRFY